MQQETCGFIGLFPQTTRKKHKKHKLFLSTRHPLGPKSSSSIFNPNPNPKPYSPMLNVGDVQSMIFHSTHPGPYKMIPAEINNRRNDKVLVGAVGK